MKLELMKTLKAVRSGQILREEDGLCVRGLEHLHILAHHKQRKINRDSVNAAVFNEQERQRAEGINNPYEIACTARYNSMWATEKALQMGLSDAVVVHQTKHTCQVIATGDALSRNSQTVRIRSSDHHMSLLQEAPAFSKSSCDVSEISRHNKNSFDHTNTPLSTSSRRAKNPLPWGISLHPQQGIKVAQSAQGIHGI